jgi:membrane associated rhomboid family serine protease
MAFRYHRLLEFNSHLLMNWGAAYAPRTFTGQWWRALSSMFLHGGLGHLAANLCFLLLMGPLVERLLGPLRFAVVYVFAGLGGALLSLGWFPSSVMVGASGAVFGVYGAFLGCYLRGFLTIPLRIFGRTAGVLILYAVITLLLDYLDLQKNLIAHLGGLLFGLVGGLLFGHVFRPRSARRWWRFVIATTACAALIAGTAWGVQRCVREPIQLLARYDAVLERERALLGRFEDAFRKWEDGDMSDTALRGLLQNQLITEWDRVRKDLGLGLPPECADMESQRLSLLRDLLAKRHTDDPNRSPKAKRKPPEMEYDELFRVYLKLRADNWRALADGLQTEHSPLVEPLMDDLFIRSVRNDLDDMANEGNPLRRWLEFSRSKIREKKQPRGSR